MPLNDDREYELGFAPSIAIEQAASRSTPGMPEHSQRELLNCRYFIYRKSNFTDAHNANHYSDFNVFSAADDH